MKKALGVGALVAALGAMSAVPAVAGQSNVVKGAVYKFTHVSAGMEYEGRVKVFKSGHKGNFSLKCAGVQRVEIEIAKGKAHLEFGADETQVKGRLRFKPNDEIKGEITKVITSGHTCGVGEFHGAAVDTD